MKTLKLLTSLFIGGSLLLSLSSCSDNSLSIDDDGEFAGEDQYIIVASSGNDPDADSYLLQTSDINGGMIDATDDEQTTQVDGKPRWFFFKDIAAYSFVYAKGNKAPGASYILDNNGQLKPRREFKLNRTKQVVGTYNDYITVGYSSGSSADPIASFQKIDAFGEAVSSEIIIPTDTLGPQGEIAYFTDMAQFGEHIFASFRPIIADPDAGRSEKFATDHPNETFIAVYDEDFEPVKVIHDEGRTGPVAGQNRGSAYTGLEVVESGDMYVFSSAIDAPEVASGVLKINEGDLSFDSDYFFNISASSGGHDLYRSYYMGGSTFILRMFNEPHSAGASPEDTKTKFAVVDVAKKTFHWIEKGIPSDITNMSSPYIDRENNRLVVGIKTEDTDPHLYSIDPDTKRMTKGIKVNAYGITAVGKLSIQ